MSCLTSFRGLRLHHVVVILAMIVGVGVPLDFAAYFLFGPSERLLSFLTFHLRLSADALTALTLLAFCLLLSLAMLAGSFFLRRFLRPIYD